MKLLYTTTSPYARKVCIVLREKQIACHWQIASPNAPNSIIPTYNPLGRVPVLLLEAGDTGTPGEAIYDSPIIVFWLERHQPNPRLIPADSAGELAVRRLEALCDGVLDAAVAIRMESLRPAALQSADWIAVQRSDIDCALAALVRILNTRMHFHGDALSLADIAAVCVLDYLSFRLPELAWRTEYPSLAALRDRLIQRPAFAETYPHD